MSSLSWEDQQKFPAIQKNKGNNVPPALYSLRGFLLLRLLSVDMKQTLWTVACGKVASRKPFSFLCCMSDGGDSFRDWKARKERGKKIYCRSESRVFKRELTRHCRTECSDWIQMSRFVGVQFRQVKLNDRLLCEYIFGGIDYCCHRTQGGEKLLL